MPCCGGLAIAHVMHVTAERTKKILAVIGRQFVQNCTGLPSSCQDCRYHPRAQQLVEAMDQETGEILTIDEVAAYLKVGKRTVYRLAAARRIPAFKVGGTWRFRRQEIDLWIKKQTAGTPGDHGPEVALGSNE